MAAIVRHLPPFAAAAVGAAVFFALTAGTSVVMRATNLEGMTARQIVLKTAMLVVAAVLMVLAARPRRVWGLAAPRNWLPSTLLPTVMGGLLGAASSATILGFGFAPMAGMREMGLLNIMAIVWVGSTVAEEVFVRGFIQGWMQPSDVGDAASVSSGSTPRILASGLLFGAMHMSLFFAGNDPRTAATIVTAATLLGLVCAWSRELSGSLVGPVLSHFAFNVSGVLGGIAVVVLTKLSGH